MVIIALDFENKEKTLNFLKNFKDESLYVKIGMELFYAEGPSIISEIKKLGHKIFLDLKLHDIPNTVMKAMKNLAKLGVDIVNCHAAGGVKMMEAAKSAFDGLDNKPMIIAVTQLTSTSKEMMNNELGIEGEVIDSVVKYAQNAKKAGLNGVVCSPLEVRAIKEACGEDFITVTPGIRPGAHDDDQVRVTTPADARKLGTNYIVVGRPITAQEDPVAAYKKIRKDFMGE
ncbi:MAG: orotidine-5'-phosphate decarboxylase [Anaeroplasmataceae bacterium]